MNQMKNCLFPILKFNNYFFEFEFCDKSFILFFETRTMM